MWCDIARDVQLHKCVHSIAIFIPIPIIQVQLARSTRYQNRIASCLFMDSAISVKTLNGIASSISCIEIAMCLPRLREVAVPLVWAWASQVVDKNSSERVFILDRSEPVNIVWLRSWKNDGNHFLNPPSSLVYLINTSEFMFTPTSYFCWPSRTSRGCEVY